LISRHSSIEQDESDALMSDLSRAEATWDTIDIAAVRSVAWLSLGPVSSDIWGTFSDGLGPNDLTSRLLSERNGVNAELAGAALVCGDMQSERTFFEATKDVRFTKVDGYDLSQVSLDRYTPNGVEWTPHKVDCNELSLPTAEFDLVVANHGAHHVANLENLFRQARTSLRSGGLFYMYEWIGPTYLQIPRRNSLIAKALLLALFPKRATRTTHMGKRKGRQYIQDAADSFDPSEACNSLQLYPEFERNFTVIREYRHGGLTYPMFEGLAQNMNTTRKTTLWRITFAVQAERLLTRLGLVRPLFVVAVGAPKL
jgi:SAM-dependent methyltransferase